MPVTALDEKTALVVIDLQKGITAMPTLSPGDEVVAQSAKLADAFRSRGLPVVLVRVAFSPDRADAVSVRTDVETPVRSLTPDWSELRPELGEADILITKRGWDAFFGTELDLQLRRRGITGIVLTGIATSIGVEATARSANAFGYELAIASDAVTDMNQAAHEVAMEVIFPRIAEIDTSEAILSALPG